MTDAPATADRLAFAHKLADAARPIALAHFRTPLDIASKADGSPVTAADRTIEAELRARIEARFPSRGIVGEERGVREGGGLTGVVAPIDGTQSFVTGQQDVPNRRNPRRRRRNPAHPVKDPCAAF